MFSGRSLTQRVLLRVFVRCCAAGRHAGCPALDVRVDASKLRTNQNMFSHPGIRGLHVKDDINYLFSNFKSFRSSVSALCKRFVEADDFPVLPLHSIFQRSILPYAQ